MTENKRKTIAEGLSAETGMLCLIKYVLHSWQNFMNYLSNLLKRHSVFQFHM